MPEVIVHLGDTFGMAPNGLVYALYRDEYAAVTDYTGNDKHVVIANKVFVAGKYYKVIHLEDKFTHKLAALHRAQ